MKFSTVQLETDLPPSWKWGDLPMRLAREIECRDRFGGVRAGVIWLKGIAAGLKGQFVRLVLRLSGAVDAKFINPDAKLKGCPIAEAYGIIVRRRLYGRWMRRDTRDLNWSFRALLVWLAYGDNITVLVFRENGGAGERRNLLQGFCVRPRLADRVQSYLTYFTENLHLKSNKLSSLVVTRRSMIRNLDSHFHRDRSADLLDAAGVAAVAGFVLMAGGFFAACIVLLGIDVSDTVFNILALGGVTGALTVAFAKILAKQVRYK